VNREPGGEEPRLSSHPHAHFVPGFPTLIDSTSALALTRQSSAHEDKEPHSGQANPYRIWEVDLQAIQRWWNHPPR
jgi:hypothetical protein